MQRLIKLFAGLLVCLASTNLAFAGVITKTPDLGNYWSPLSANGGTYIYANSFVADSSGNVTGLGTWLNRGGSDLVFQIFGSIGDNPAQGPDSSNLLATSSILSGLYFESLTYVNGGPVTSFANLIAGNTYWFAASTVGQNGSGAFTVGGHTQNSEGIVDNGTFWYSNDNTGRYFDGRNRTPEMAFSVTISENSVPEPASLALLGLGLFGFAMARQRKQ
jgi:hypothetical protein